MPRILSVLASLVLCVALTAATNSAIVPVIQDGDSPRHEEKVRAASQETYDLLLIGDSITENLETTPFRPVWDHYFAPRHTLNLGYGGARTENILWNLAHGELDGQSPRVAILLIGTNNSDDANYPVVHSAEQTAAGTAAIIDLLRTRSPRTKILLLAIFPRERVYRLSDGTELGDHRARSATNARINELYAQMADGNHVIFLDINHIFLRPDGTIDSRLMPDLLHPSPAGAEAWAKAMEPTLRSLLADREDPLQTEGPSPGGR
ncbi:MAG: hypothetical protein RL091_1166 [Verrucomicrobiota bacterium]|jgi:lysophospholipase L1-like esterase